MGEISRTAIGTFHRHSSLNETIRTSSITVNLASRLIAGVSIKRNDSGKEGHYPAAALSFRSLRQQR